VLAERSVDDAQALGRWRARWARSSHEIRVALYVELLQRRGPLPVDATDYPLAIASALDTVHAERRPLPNVAKAGAPALEIDGAHYRLLRRVPSDESRRRPAEQRSPNLEAWFRHFRVIPDRVHIGAAAVNIRVEALGYVAPHRAPEAADLRFRVSHFTDAAILHAEEDHEAGNFFAPALDGALEREQSVDAELELVRREAANLWLAPELTVTVALRRRVALALAERRAESLLLCVPGTCHEFDGPHRVNRALVFNGNGQRVAHQDKCSQFSYPAGAGQLHEAIDARRSVTLLVTPIGIVGVAICKDHFDASASGLIRACWDRLAPDWLLVPSMGDARTVEAHRKRAKEAWDVRCTRSIVANQEARVTACEETPAPGFVRRGDVAEPVAIGGSTFASTPEPADPEPPRRGVALLKRVK
jgi:hypothetical protein